MADDGSDFARSMSIATSGLRAQAGRMRVISENIANADSTAPNAGGNPYRRKVPTFSSALDRTLDAKVVTLGKVRPDQSPFRIKHEPSNPSADAAGNVNPPALRGPMASPWALPGFGTHGNSPTGLGCTATRC